MPWRKSTSAFHHINAPDLPLMDNAAFSGRLIIGSLHGLSSPVIQHAETLYADIRIHQGGRFQIPPTTEERAIYTLEGNVGIGGEVFPPDRLLAFRPGDDIVVQGRPEARISCFSVVRPSAQGAIYGGISWLPSKERIEQAKEEWRTGRFLILCRGMSRISFPCQNSGLLCGTHCEAVPAVRMLDLGPMLVIPAKV